MWRDAGMQITIKIEAGLQFSAKGGSARQIAHIFCRQQFARLNVEFLPTMFQHSRTDLKCNQPPIWHHCDMEVDAPLPSNSAQTPPISHFTSLEWSPALFQCSLQCAVHLSPLWLSRFTTLKWSQSHNFTLGGRQWWFYPEIAQVQKRSKNLDKHLLLIWLHLKNLGTFFLFIWLPLLQKFVVCNDKAMQIIHTINVACLIANVCKSNRAST